MTRSGARARRAQAADTDAADDNYAGVRMVKLSELAITEIAGFILSGDHEGGCLLLATGEVVMVMAETVH